MNNLEKVLVIIILFVAIWFIGSYIEVMLINTTGAAYSALNFFSVIF